MSMMSGPFPSMTQRNLTPFVSSTSKFLSAKVIATSFLVANKLRTATVPL